MQTIDLKNLSTEEKKEIVANLLNSIADEKVLLGTNLFNAIARHTVGISLEGVLFKKDPIKKIISIFLTKRSDNEAYAGQWHCPGSFLRAGEDDIKGMYRLGVKEFGKKPIKHFLFCGEAFVPEERFETMLNRVYLVKYTNPTNPDGKWFDICDLHRTNIVEAHRDFVIPLALKIFCSQEENK